MSSQVTPEENSSGAAPARLLFRNILHGSSLYSLTIVGGALVSIILLPVNTRFLTKADYGVMDLLEKVTVAVSLLLGLNFSAALGYFYFSKGTRAERAPILGTMFAGSLMIGLVTGAVGWFASDLISREVFRSPEYVGYLRAIFVMMPFTFVLEVGLSWLRAEERQMAFVASSFFRIGIVLVGTLIGVALLHKRIWGVQTANLTAIGLSAIALAVYFFRLYHPVRFDSALFIRMVRFSFPLGLSGMAMFIIHFGDRFILPHFHPFDDLGIYSVAYKIGMLISVIHGSFANYWNAQIYQIAKREDADVVIARTFSYLMLILTFCGVGLIIAAKPVLHLLAARAFWDATMLVPVIVLAYYARAVGDFFRCVFLVEGRPGYDAACNWIGASVCLAGYFLLIPRWSVWGAAYATLITFVVIAVISVIWVNRLKPFRVEGARLTKIVLAAIVPLVVYPFVHTGTSRVLEIAWSALMISSYPVLLVLLRFPTAGEWNMAHALAPRVRALLGAKVVE